MKQMILFFLLLMPGGLAKAQINPGSFGDDCDAFLQREILGPQFREFVDRVNSVPADEKQAIIDSFMNAAPSFPFVEEDTIVYYIYQGEAAFINVPGDANHWDTGGYPMVKLNETSFWYSEAVFESDARLDYKYLLDGSQWIPDPLNPHQVSGNSELAMPDYVQPPEILYYPDIPHGKIDTFTFTSNILGNSRVIVVYKPFNYDSSDTDLFPVLLLHDGIQYIDVGKARNTLDYEIADNKMRPVICVFVPPVDRENEYAFDLTQQFESFIITELMPHIDSHYRTISDPHYRAMGGLSWGGLISTQICYNNPENFGLSAMFSPAFQPLNMLVFNMVLNGPLEDIKWYIDWGTYEVSIMEDAVVFRDSLLNKGYELTWNEWHEAHSWGSWRAHLDNALEYLFPPVVGVKTGIAEPEEFTLMQNYPNPFNPATKISWQSPVSGWQTLKVYDILGREVTTLVDEYRPAGRYNVEFIISNEQLSSGVYFYRLKVKDFIQTKKMLLIK